MQNVKKTSAAGIGALSNPMSHPMGLPGPAAAPPTVNATPQIKPTPTPAPTGLWDKITNTASNAMGGVKDWATGQFGGEFGRAKVHYDNATKPIAEGGKGQNPFMAGIGAAGQLDPMTRGIGGGALGMMGAGMMAPHGSRGWAMPAATGLGAMFSMANGPDGFKWENMLKPESLMAGGIGAGAGYLGSKLLGDDEEDDNEYDPAGLHHHRRPAASGGSSWLPALAGVGALGLGAYGLHKYMNPEAAAQTPATAMGATGGAAGIAGGAARPPAPQPPPPMIPGITAGSLGADPAHQVAWNNPQALTRTAERVGAGRLPGEEQNLRNFLHSTSQAELGMGNPNGAIQPSKIYHDIYSGKHPELINQAKPWMSAMDATNRVAGGIDKFPGLERAEALRYGDADSDQLNAAPKFPIKNMAALGAYGFKDFNDLANAAADGDQRVLQFVKTIGPEDQKSLIKTLTDPGYHEYRPATGVPVQLPASAANPRAGALLGAATAGSTGQQLTPEPYDTRALLQAPDQLRSTLTPGQKYQLMQDLNNPESMAEKFKGMSPEEAQMAARNIGGLMSRTAHGHAMPTGDTGPNTPKPTPNWIDENVQSAMARIAGNPNYKPVGIRDWDALSSQGLDGSRGLSPYLDPNNKTFHTVDTITGRQNNPGSFNPSDLVLNRTAQNDEATMADWADVMRNSARGVVSKDDHLGPMAVQLHLLHEHRPDLYNHLLKSLQRDQPQQDWATNLTNFRNGGSKNVNGLNVNTGLHIDGEGNIRNPMSPTVQGGDVGMSFYN